MELTIERMAYGPDGIAHAADGKAVFVAGGVAGDVVEARIVSEGASLDRAVVKRVIEPSPSRVDAPCPFAGACGGCPWAGLSIETQREAKEQNLKSSLARIGGFAPDEVERIVQPIRHTNEEWGYRNKIELAPVVENGRVRLGLHGRDPEQVIRPDRCPLFESKHAKLLKSVTGALAYLSGSHDLGLERVGIRASRRTNAVEVALWTPTGGFPRAQVARVLSDAVPGSAGIVRVMSKGEKKARRVSSIEVLGGRARWTERLGSEKMHISAPSFFQVNTRAAEILIKLVLEALDPGEDDVACDLYCGAGTFTLPLARRCAFVSAVESYGPAVRDLRCNLDRAGLDNVDVIGGDAVREFPGEDADVLVVDPPRAGLAPEAIGLIASTPARDVAYVSCDPATLARDLKRFRDEGTFRVESAVPVDLFPQTFHCETVVHLRRI